MRGIKRNHGIETEPGAWGLLAGLMVLLLGLVAANGGCAHHHGRRDVLQRYEAAVELAVTCAGDIFGPSHGSGVVVSRDRLLTAAHMIRKPDCVYFAEDVRGEMFIVRPLVVLETLDLASMEIVSPVDHFDFHGVNFGPPPRLGSTACAATAFPTRVHKCSEVYPSRDTPGDIVISAIIDRGNSGSALYDSDGALVGIVVHLITCSNSTQICGGHASSLEGHVKELLP